MSTSRDGNSQTLKKPSSSPPTKMICRNWSVSLWGIVASSVVALILASLNFQSMASVHSASSTSTSRYADYYVLSLMQQLSSASSLLQQPEQQVPNIQERNTLETPSDTINSETDQPHKFHEQNHSQEQNTNKIERFDVCIAGAGLSGAVLAERYATTQHKRVLIVEKRNHIGGNCFDYMDPDTNIRVSLYGAHLFHTNYPHVRDYVQEFSEWIPYEHKVRAIVNGKYVPVPVNMETVNTLFDLNIQSKAQLQEWLQKEQVLLDGPPQNSEQVALSRVGPRLYDLIFRPYTRKQWNKDPSELGPEVLARIPVRDDKEDRYFSDDFQALPANGYTAFFERLLSSPLITVRLNTDFLKIQSQLHCDKVYFTGPIDHYFASTGWPKLEYRSLQFERVVLTNLTTESPPRKTFQPHFVVNHPQNNTDFTRIVEYKHMYNQKDKPGTVYFIERSSDEGDPYYPVPNDENKALYRKYQDLAAKEANVTFVGRLANYKYFNMDQAIHNALQLFEQDTGIPFRGFAQIGLNYAWKFFNKTHTRKKTLVTEAEVAAIQSRQLVSRADMLAHYRNDPVVDEHSLTLQERLQQALTLPVGDPVGLRHTAHPPGNNVIMGLAAYPRNMGTFRLLVGSLRNAGYDGHIILGVHKEIPPDEEAYLQKMQVTYYTVDFIACDPTILDNAGGGGAIRGKCSPGLETLTLEWGRFEMCRQWLHACKECTGWALVMDTRDIFFQRDPFDGLPPADTSPYNLMFMEEIAPHSNPAPETPHRADILGKSRYVARTEMCYGKNHHTKYFARPVLCSGTIMGTRRGMHRFLSVLVDEFHSNNRKGNKSCRSPIATDQWTMDYLYYNGRFGFYNQTKTIPWGRGPINTIGTPCINRAFKEGRDKYSQKDLIEFDPETNLILNNHEPRDSPFRVVAGVHQFDRCGQWTTKFLSQHPEFSQRNGRDGGYIPTNQLQLPWEEKTSKAQ